MPSKQTPPKQPPEPAKKLAEYICANAALTDPMGNRCMPGQPLPEFESWGNDQARMRLLRMGWVVRAQDWNGPVELPRPRIPEPILVASSEPQPPVANMPEAPEFPFDQDLGDGIRCDHTERPTGVVELVPGTVIQLADGTTYEVPKAEPPRTAAALDAQEGAPVACLQCDKQFNGINSLKVHEAEQHAEGELL